MIFEAQAAFEAARAKPVAPAKPRSPADGRADALAQGTPPNTQNSPTSAAPTTVPMFNDPPQTGAGKIEA